MASTSQTHDKHHHHHHHLHHHHHHHHDNTFLVSSNKKDAGVRITRIGLYVNLGMAIGKGFGGYVFNSQALIADAVHSLTDLVSDVMTLATISWSLKPPSERFPSGYGKVESLGSLGVSGILLGGGAMIGWSAILALCQQFFPDFVEMAANLGLLPHHGHSHNELDLGPNINAAWLAGGSIVIKEWLYHATLKIANERKSTVLASNAYHHRVDSLTAFVALLMIGGSHFLSNASWLDPIGGLVISLMVIQAGWGNTKAALLELADVGIDDEIRSEVEKQAQQALEKHSIAKLRRVQGVKSGQNYLMELEVGVPAKWSVQQTQEIEKDLRDWLGAKVRGVKKVKVSFVPKDSAPTSVLDEFVGPTVERESSGVENSHSTQRTDSHEHAYTNGNVNKRR